MHGTLKHVTSARATNQIKFFSVGFPHGVWCLLLHAIEHRAQLCKSTTCHENPSRRASQATCRMRETREAKA